MILPNLQQALAAYPVLAIFAAVIVGGLALLTIRILFHSLGCLVHLGCALIVGVAIFLLLRAIIFH